MPFNISAARSRAWRDGVISESFSSKPIARACQEQCSVAMLPGRTITATPRFAMAVRIAIGISWVVVVAAEMLGVESGLGYLVLDARNQLRYDRVVAAMLSIGVIGVLADGIVRSVERGELARRGIHP